jgi:hypothetical protein
MFHRRKICVHWPDYEFIVEQNLLFHGHEAEFGPLEVFLFHHSLKFVPRAENLPLLLPDKVISIA